jgi:bacteriocin-like protein
LRSVTGVTVSGVLKAVGSMVLPKEKTMDNRRIDPKSGVIELNDEQLKSVTGGRKAGSGPYLVITMKEVLISSVTHGSTQDHD